MNFQQLRSLRETVRRGLNLTSASEALHISQPALSKQIREFEDELGLLLFVRHGKKFTGLTEAGQRILAHAERVLSEADNLKRTGADMADGQSGTLAIAATHTQARFVLPSRLAQLRDEYPKVRLRLHQGNPEQVAAMVSHGEATFGLATEALDRHPGLRTHPAYRWHHCLVVRRDHPLAGREVSELAELVRWPLITYTPEFAGRRVVDAVLAAHQLEPEVVLEAIDSDIIKTYVSLGFGVGLIHSIAHDPERDRDLVTVSLERLLPANVAKIATRRDVVLRGFERRFLELVTAAYNGD